MKHISVFLDEFFSELFEERAAILQFEAGFTQEEAEKLARQEVEARVSWKASALDGANCAHRELDNR